MFASNSKFWLSAAPRRYYKVCSLQPITQMHKRVFNFFTPVWYIYSDYAFADFILFYLLFWAFVTYCIKYAKCFNTDAYLDTHPAPSNPLSSFVGISQRKHRNGDSMQGPMEYDILKGLFNPKILNISCHLAAWRCSAFRLSQVIHYAERQGDLFQSTFEVNGMVHPKSC